MVELIEAMRGIEPQTVAEESALDRLFSAAFARPTEAEMLAVLQAGGG